MHNPWCCSVRRAGKHGGQRGWNLGRAADSPLVLHVAQAGLHLQACMQAGAGAAQNMQVIAGHALQSRYTYAYTGSPRAISTTCALLRMHAAAPTSDSIRGFRPFSAQLGSSANVPLTVWVMVWAAQAALQGHMRKPGVVHGMHAWGWGSHDQQSARPARWAHACLACLPACLYPAWEATSQISHHQTTQMVGSPAHTEVH